MTDIWNSSESALVVVDYVNAEGLKNYRDALRDNGLNVNNCVILTVVNSKKEREILSQNNTLAVFISPSDFNWLGKLKNPEVQKQMNRKFDLVIIIGDKPKPILKYIAKQKIKMRVSMNCTKNGQDVNLNTVESKPAHLINFAKNTLTKIN